MHEKVLNVLYEKLLNGKTKNEVNAMKARCPTKRPVGAAALGLKAKQYFFVIFNFTFYKYTITCFFFCSFILYDIVP